MKPFKSFAQAGQDVFALAVCPEGKTFLDIGACHPTEISNTYALEQRGWRGLLFDNDPGAVRLCREQRESPTIEEDVTRFNWDRDLLGSTRWICKRNGRQERVPFEYGFGSTLKPSDSTVLVDFLSLDVDAATLPTLRNMPLKHLRFRVIVAEHDSYRFGNEPRDEMRKILTSHGYFLVCADVCSADGTPYEDWWVDHNEVPFDRYERFRSTGLRWPEIIARA